jgi:hypothetical protein
VSDPDSSLDEALRLLYQDKALYNILHTGNKPSGSYTGNGSAAERVIDTGGIGSTIIICSGFSWAIVRSTGLVLSATSSGGVPSVSYLSYNEARFRDGVLTLHTANSAVNPAGAAVEYYVL